MDTVLNFNMTNKELRDEFYKFMENDELKTEDICAWFLERYTMRDMEILRKIKLERKQQPPYVPEASMEGQYVLEKKIEAYNSALDEVEDFIANRN